MRTGIALGRPLVRKMGQFFQPPSPGGAPITYSEPIPPGGRKPYNPMGRRECLREWIKENPSYSSLDVNSPLFLHVDSPQLASLMKSVDPDAFERCYALPVMDAEYFKREDDAMQKKWNFGLTAHSVFRNMQNMPTFPGLQGLGSGNGSSGLGSKNSLGAGGIPLLASSIVSIPLQAAATWVGFHTGSEETGWLSAAGYVVGIVGAIGTLVSLLGLVVGTAVEVAD